MGIHAHYRKLPRRERALKDVVYVIYHFFVAALTLGAIGIVGASQKDPLAPLALFFSGGNLVAGGVLLALHRALLKGPNRDAYVQIVTSALGTHDYPLIPMLLSVVVAASLFFAGLYMYAN